eukprot:TRINITY_DN14857_c0_g3_i1.p1 TRINITY_DN14857_c0_g3~~TRINITY_DN14857_c0_g3_i1.p1  ORF type:complete len:358 (-),score=84.02 TRINITY_DN14857_c0_g3_i1:30-1067(-)
MAPEDGVESSSLALAKELKRGGTGESAPPADGSVGNARISAAECEEAAPIPPPVLELCESRRFAEEFVARLQFSPEARAVVDAGSPPQRPCEECGRSSVVICTKCVRAVVPLPPPLRLGLQAHVLRAPKEAVGRSSAASLPLLAPEDVRLHGLGEPGAAAALEALAAEEGTWLVYPREDAVEVTDVDWAAVRNVVLIDCRWAVAGAILKEHPAIARLPALRLSHGARSAFHRPAASGLPTDVGLVSTAECLWLLLQARAQSPAARLEEYERLDDLLYLFALQSRMVADRYSAAALADGGAGAVCCPKCRNKAKLERFRVAAVARKEREQRELPTAAPAAAAAAAA